MEFGQLTIRIKIPAAIFALSALVYVLSLQGQWRSPPGHFGNHYVHLANSYLHGQLSVVGDAPPSNNDWAEYNGKWFVSFPPFPALLMLPFVAAFGLDIPDRLLWAIFAGLAPMLLFLLLRRLREQSLGTRSLKQDLGLVALFAFGSVYFFSAVNGSVWYAAHVVASALIAGYALCAIEARAPFTAGLLLGCAFLTRPTTLFLGLFFLFENMLAAPKPGNVSWVSHALGPERLRRVFSFALPLAASVLVAIILNYYRFEDPFEFGHALISMRWRPRTDRWGLFNYVYFPKNLAIFVASLPWLTKGFPYFKISTHGLALWFTTPFLLRLLWPVQKTLRMWAMLAAVLPVMLIDLCYQNSGWVQFGYRFALDYLVLLIVLIAIMKIPLGRWFWFLLLVSIGINSFGALTFQRRWEFYHSDPTQRILFQPDTVSPR